MADHRGRATNLAESREPGLLLSMEQLKQNLKCNWIKYHEVKNTFLSLPYILLYALNTKFCTVGYYIGYNDLMHRS